MLKLLTILATFSSASAFLAAPRVASRPAVQARAAPVPVAMSGAVDDFVPDMQRRTIMNLVLLGGAGVPVLWMLGGFVYFFVPPGGGGGGLIAKDANGDDVLVQSWIKANPFPGRSLV